MNFLYFSIILISLLSVSSAAEQGCVFSDYSGELKCVLLNSSDFTPFLPQEDRSFVRWLSLYVGTSEELHTDPSVPISYPDLSLFEKVSFVRVYIYSDSPSVNYSPEMFASTPGAISVVSLYTVQPVPFNIRSIGTQANLQKLKILSVSNFNISGVTNLNLQGLSGLESLQLSSAEGGQERILLDSLFKLGETLPKLAKLRLEDFRFAPLLTSRGLLRPLHTLQSLILKMTSDTGTLDESIFFSRTIFPVLNELQLLGFDFSHLENAVSFQRMPLLTKLRLQARTLHSLPLSVISQPEGGAQTLVELNLDNFNIGNLSSSVLGHLPLLEKLYLSGSEDTFLISNGAFLSNGRLSKLRVTSMPNLETIESDAFLGLNKLVYLHLGSLNGLRVLSANTSSLYLLSSLYLTSNRELSEVPVEFFLPLISLQVLNVRSSKFDEECSCRHSYLSSLLTFSRPDPPFRLSSSCHEAGEFTQCSKSYQGNMCWDFLDTCPHFCIPSGNLSYSCACPSGQGDLEEGAACVELFGCGQTGGVVSHYCHSDSFSCVTHYRNQTISCSCYSDHVLNPDKQSCRSLSGCEAEGDVFRCQGEGMECDSDGCECVDGTNWDPVSKICLGPTTPTTTVTTTPAETTTTTIASTTTPTIPTTTITLEDITTTTPTATTPEETTTITTQEVTTPAPTTTQTTTVTIPTTPVVEITTPSTTTLATPQTTTIATTTATTTTTTTATTTPVVETTTTPTVEVTTPSTTTLATPQTTTTPKETTTPAVEVTTPTTQEPAVTVLDTGTTEPPVVASILPISSNMAYILGLTLGSVCVGSIILILVLLVVVLLVKILVYNRDNRYRVKPESMRSFESSNTSSPPSAIKELPV